MKTRWTQLEPGHWIALAVETTVLFVALYFVRIVGGRDEVEFAISAITALTGVALGGFAGALASPRGDEKGAFDEYKKTLGAFLSGFVLSKLDSVFVTWFKPIDASPTPSMRMVRLGLFLVAFMVGLFATFMIRQYGHSQSRPGQVTP